MTTGTNGHNNAAYDVAVIGGGAAGLSGALALVRSRRTVLVIDGGQPRNAPAEGVHNYLTRDGTPPAELMALGRDEVTRYGGQVVAGNVADIERLGNDARDGFLVTLADGSRVQARRVLVATGLVDELPDIPGVAERWGRDVIHCAYCHGWEVRDQAIGILGSGPMAVHSALMFRQLSDDVTLFQHIAPPLSAEQAEQLAARGIAVVDGEVAALTIHDDRLTGVQLRSGKTVPRRAVVVAPRVLARAAMLRGLGLETTEQKMGDYVFGTAIAADANGATSVPGVWVAGNVAEPMGQVISAAAAGLKVGAVINADLIAEETSRAVAGVRARAAETPAPTI